MHLLWVGVGTVEPERMRAGLQRLHTSLLDANIQHIFYESPGTDHEWQTWRRDLKDFYPAFWERGQSTWRFITVVWSAGNAEERQFERPIPNIKRESVALRRIQVHLNGKDRFMLIAGQVWLRHIKTADGVSAGLMCAQQFLRTERDGANVFGDAGKDQ